MQNVTIMHNPYKLTSVIKVNGEEPKKDSKLIQFLNQRFQLWVDKIPSLLADEYNDDEFGQAPGPVPCRKNHMASRTVQRPGRAQRDCRTVSGSPAAGSPGGSTAPAVL